MRPPPLPARRAAPPAPPPEPGESLWHVAIAPDDVKVITLEKLDDLFRLDIINESTKVWRPGMAQWQPLGIVAGIDDEDSHEADQPTQVQKHPLAPAAAPAPRHMDSEPPTPVVTTVPPAVLLAAMSDASQQQVATLAPPAVTASAWPAPAAAQPLSAVPLHEVAEEAPPARGMGRAQRSVLALSVVAGLLVTLYRNDVLLDAARAAGQESAYLRLESALGGPGFGTPRSLEKLGAAPADAP
ncbi:hypothetical protein SOCEGT47_030490 [Sorangium cellulosum]|uniref:GYF domain-containing protein n=1 Tax=Sorangium cellulosum TaxID=56 RepID=A0A4P2Q0W7_SORCE|nr:DUF4339 domain-containing protein [Sorangium cellulosum]AUX22546.1 hypothetical protein SOCEGT47_030490 [Sorangium cellulosum]